MPGLTIGQEVNIEISSKRPLGSKAILGQNVGSCAYLMPLSKDDHHSFGRSSCCISVSQGDRKFGVDFVLLDGFLEERERGEVGGGRRLI